MESEKNETEIEKGRHLRLRRVMVDLTGASASRIALGSGGLTGGGELLDVSRGKGRRGRC